MRGIIVYRCGTLGDTIVAVPAIQALREAFPDAPLTLVTASSPRGGIWADAVLREFGWFEHFVTYDPHDLTVAAINRLIYQVRQIDADMVFYLGSERNSWLRVFRDRLFFALAGKWRFVGASSDSVTWYCRLRRSDRIYPHEVTRLRAFAEDAGGSSQGAVRFDLPITDAHRARVDELLTDTNIPNARLLIGVCPGSRQSAKRWPEERFAEIGRRLIEKHGAYLLVVGGDDERMTGERIARSRWPDGSWANAASRLSVLESAELLRRCRMYIGNDTGAMHLASAVGTSCLAIFAARCPERSWNPYGDGHIVIQRRVPCRNCFLSECTVNRLRCLNEIDVDEVWSACQRMLSYQ
jgi:ADP-heptose:LPS heptosyltransferase